MQRLDRTTAPVVARADRQPVRAALPSRWTTGPAAHAGQVTGDGGPVLDMAALENLLDLIGDEPEIMVEMIDSYLETAPPLLAQLNQSLASGDAAAFRLAAHTLKSMVGNFCASSAQEAAFVVESNGRRGDLAACRLGAASLEQEVRRLQQDLHDFLDEIASTSD